LTYSAKRRLATAASAIVLGLAAGPAMAQWATEADMIAANPDLPWTDRYESESVGRGWDFVDPEQYDLVGATTGFTGARFGQAEDVIAARDGAVPEGIEALERDLYTSDDFYIDQDLWSDPRYFRCNSGLANESQWGAYGGEIIGPDGPATAAWGYCDRDYPRDAIISPYPFETAQEHYEALRAEAEANNNPAPTAEELQEWTGRYQRMPLENWWYMRINQIPTILSLLTEEYQTHMVQEAYHQGNTNAAQWQSQYCWPEGFMRRFHQYSVRGHEMIATPSVVQWLTGVADNFLTQIHIGREFNMEGAVPRLGQDVPRWWGETIGFWDGDALITWTSNIQSWKTHNAFEHSNQLQTIEIYTPQVAEDGRFSIFHESIFYDPAALLQPVRQVREFVQTSGYEEGDPYIFVECNQTIFPIDGRAQPVSPGQVIDYRVPDMFGRPWAQIWEEYFEQDMERPEAEALFGF